MAWNCKRTSWSRSVGKSEETLWLITIIFVWDTNFGMMARYVSLMTRTACCCTKYGTKSTLITLFPIESAALVGTIHHTLWKKLFNMQGKTWQRNCTKSFLKGTAMIKYEFITYFYETRMGLSWRFDTTLKYQKNGLLSYENWGWYFDIYYDRDKRQTYTWNGVQNSLKKFLRRAERELPESQYEKLFERHSKSWQPFCHVIALFFERIIDDMIFIYGIAMIVLILLLL